MRRSVWILGDQLLTAHPALLAAQAESDPVTVVMVESRARFDRLPYHQHKRVLLISAMRHYAGMLRRQGIQVDYRRAATTRQGLSAHLAEWQPAEMLTMAASEIGGRQFQRRLAESAGVTLIILPNTQFLVGRFDPFPAVAPGKRVVLETFYRAMRQQFNLLLEPDGTPTGGRWNFDAENRQPLPRGVQPPPVITFPPDEITAAVIGEVAAEGRGVGSTAGFALAVTHEQAQAALQDFIIHRLADFGRYEDAMSSRSAVVYHAGIAAYLNLGLLEPLAVAQAVEAAYRAGQAPLNSAEGFIRQVAGWREYIYWQYHRQMPGLLQGNALAAQRALPGFFWDGDTRMNCLRQVLRRVRESGYVHHIERLMVLSNFCLLAGVTPQEVNDWFLSSFIDAYEWVMAPNVLGMGLFADGGGIATKPYAASGSYINRMSDYCRGCSFNVRQRTGEHACPFNLLYWRFLLVHEAALRRNPRMFTSLLGLKRLGAGEREQILAQAEDWLAENVPLRGA